MNIKKNGISFDAPALQVNPWTTLNSFQMYENPWISLTEHQVLNPSGKPGIYGVVHFKGDAVGVVPYDDGHVWLVGQYRYALNQYSWEIPEGGSPPGESTLDTAWRELKEETGLTAEHYEPLLEMHLSNSVSDEWGIVYLATGLSMGDAEPEDTEDLKVCRMPLDEVFSKIESGQITDSLTVASIYKLMILKLQGKLD
ncbi:NUDIX hydrolase [Pontibacter sp. G13]|uniref:NUDIX hydrolase n=1 Tax=Pontibacter sp. G13 TaxID=3074898 RepID=UPI00288B90D9|nr:NUDIX hydrolase [Pontibacter sp. G13]WNJ19830.1 NUDIX hydrolase [Pontibacter sp. G13]